jgi:hypothetical protein
MIAPNDESGTSGTPADAAAPVDPVAEARKRLAAQESGAGDELASLRKQVRALWIVTGVTLVLALVLAVFTLLPRFGVRMGGFQGRPGGFTPGQGQGQGQGQFDDGGPGVQTAPGQGQTP